MNRRHLAIRASLVGLGLVTLVAGFWVTRIGPSGVGQAAPQVDYVLLDGQKLNPGRLKGRVVLVNFWATSCGTCVAEMPQIAATFEEFQARGYQTVAVAVSSDPPALVADFALAKKLPLGVAIDNTGQIALAFGGVALTPTSLFDRPARQGRRPLTGRAGLPCPAPADRGTAGQRLTLPTSFETHAGASALRPGRPKTCGLKSLYPIRQPQTSCASVARDFPVEHPLLCTLSEDGADPTQSPTTS